MSGVEAYIWPHPDAKKTCPLDNSNFCRTLHSCSLPFYPQCFPRKILPYHVKYAFGEFYLKLSKDNDPIYVLLLSNFLGKQGNTIATFITLKNSTR